MRITFISLICLLFLIIGCKSDNALLKEITTEDLVGEWEIYRAVRNGKVTKSLESANIVFQADNLVSSNLFATTNSLNFTYDKGTIRVSGDPNLEVLNIKTLQNDTLILSAKMKVFEMEFYFAKK